jgi:hypothetical protein
MAVRFAARPVSCGLAALLVAGCEGGGPAGLAGDGSTGSLRCSIPTEQIFDGGPGKDGIPALTNPPLVDAGDPAANYLRDDDRVIGLVLDGQVIAVPHNIGWWHEIVNLELGGRKLAITYCPLTGSSLAFDRTPIGGAELGVSGLLFRNNLIMYDRSRSESLWPQMLRGARCGPRDGTELPMLAVAEMTWVGWRSLHPDTRVVSGDLRLGRNYRAYPYGDYERTNNARTLFPLRIDSRRPPKERVLGVPVADGGIAFPFGELANAGTTAVAAQSVQGRFIVVFWDAAREAAVAHESRNRDRALTFAVRDGEIIDAETGSRWAVDGFATGGPLTGSRLEPVPESFVAFWFAWAAFQPATQIWTNSR